MALFSLIVDDPFSACFLGAREVSELPLHGRFRDSTVFPLLSVTAPIVVFLSIWLYLLKIYIRLFGSLHRLSQRKLCDLFTATYVVVQPMVLTRGKLSNL